MSSSPSVATAALAATATEFSQPGAEYAALVRAAPDGDTHEAEQVDPQVTALAAPSPSITGGLGANQTLATAVADDRLSLYERHKQLVPAAAPVAQIGATAEMPANLEPLSQQQYQTLLREMKLCNTMQPQPQQGGHLQTRDLNQPAAASRTGSSRPATRQQHHQQQQASQQMSHLLHTNHKDELIHLHRSARYCEADFRHGFAGVQSRVCSNRDNAPDNCDRLCCGRGHRTLTLKTVSSCNCKFQYCCTVTCQVCAQESKVLVCN